MSLDLADYARGLVGNPATPYGGRLNAGMSGGETDLLSALNKMVMGGDGANAPFLFGPQRNSLIGDVLSGSRLRPETNPYLSENLDFFRKQAGDTLGSNMNLLDAAFGRGGVGNGSGRSRESIDLARRSGMDTNAQIANILGNNFQNGQNEQMNVLGNVLPGMDSFKTNLLFSTLGANALPRQVEQSGLNNSYNEFIRMLGEPMQNLQMALGVLSGTPGLQFTQPQYKPSAASQILGAASQAGQAALPFML